MEGLDLMEVAANVPADAVLNPFTVIVDTREQLPYTFPGLVTDAKAGRKSLFVPTRELGLPAGDYSIDGYADKVAIERKSYADLAGTLTMRRQQFLRELTALAAMPVAWVVCEVDLATMMTSGPTHSHVLPKTLWRSIMAFQVRFPTVHWWLCPSRDVAEAVTFRLLEKWWNEMMRKESEHLPETVEGDF